VLKCFSKVNIKKGVTKAQSAKAYDNTPTTVRKICDEQMQHLSIRFDTVKSFVTGHQLKKQGSSCHDTLKEIKTNSHKGYSVTQMQHTICLEWILEQDS
jgi:hypothetical protein